MAKHNDQFAEETKYSNQDRKEEFEPFNATATDDITISHPNVRREEIELQKSLLVAMAQENRAEFDYEDDSGGQCVDAIFEEALCDVAELALQSAGIELDDSQVPIHKLRALMILIARELDSYQELADHIATYSSEEIDQFGLQQIYEKSTYRKAAKKLKDADEYKTLIDATFIAVWALFWNGVPIPKLIKENYDLSYTAGPSASDFEEESRQLGLYALGEDMLEIILEHLDLYPDKDGLNQEVCRRLIGAFAHAAIQDRSVENYEDTAQHLFDLDSALKGSGVRRRIDELSLDQIEKMFAEINQALLEFVVDSGIMSEPFIVSYDLTKIQSLGRNEFDPKYLTKDVMGVLIGRSSNSSRGWSGTTACTCDMYLPVKMVRNTRNYTYRRFYFAASRSLYPQIGTGLIW